MLMVYTKGTSAARSRSPLPVRFTVPPAVLGALVPLAKDDRQHMPHICRAGPERLDVPLTAQHHHKQHQLRPRLTCFLLGSSNGLSETYFSNASLRAARRHSNYSLTGTPIYVRRMRADLLRNQRSAQGRQRLCLQSQNRPAQDGHQKRMKLCAG